MEIPLITEDVVESLVKKVTEKSLEGLKKLTDDVYTTLYDTVEAYLYEHYSNFEDNLKSKVINQIAELYVYDPKDYKFQSIRDKMWLEHSEEIKASLTDTIIEKNLDQHLLLYTSDSYYFNWRWKRGIADFILKTPELLSDKKVQDCFNQKFQNEIYYLKKQIEEKDEIIEDLRERREDGRIHDLEDTFLPDDQETF